MLVQRSFIFSFYDSVCLGHIVRLTLIYSFDDFDVANIKDPDA